MACDTEKKEILVLGLGNPILGDDGIGCRVAELIGERMAGSTPGLSAFSASVSPIRLMEEISGYRRLIVIDSVTTGCAEPGELLEIEFSSSSRSSTSAHDFSVDRLLETGDALGMDMPKYIRVYGIEIRRPRAYGNELSAVLKNRLPLIANEIIDNEIKELNIDGVNRTPRGEPAV